MTRKAIVRKFKAIFCAVFRHSRICETCFGYIYCGRCGVQLGDNIAGVGLEGHLGIDQTCMCDRCKETFKNLTWVDRFLCPKFTFPTPEFVERKNAERKALFESIERRNRERQESRQQ